MESDIIPLTICLLSLAAAYILIPANKYKSATIILALLAVLIRIAIVFYLYRNGTDTFGTDGLLYHQEGIRVAQQLADGVPLYSVKYSYTWYTVFVGLIYHIFGINRYIASYINIELAFFSAILLFKMALNHKYQFVNAAFISLAFLYFPNLFLWTADSRKEAFLIFVCLLCWHTVQRFIIGVEHEKRVTAASLIRILFVCFLIWLCTLIRIYMFAPLAAGIIVSQLLLYKRSRARMSIVFAVVVCISSFIIFFAAVNPLTRDYHAISFSKEQTASVVQDVGNKVETVKSIASGRNIILSIVNYLVLPYPGNVDFADIRGNHQLEFVVDMDMIAWYICLLLMLTGIYSTFKRRDSCFMGLLTYAAAYVIINATVAENVADTILRYRSVIIGTSLLFIDGDVFRNIYTRFESYMRFKSGPAKVDTISSYSKH